MLHSRTSGRQAAPKGGAIRAFHEVVATLILLSTFIVELLMIGAMLQSASTPTLIQTRGNNSATGPACCRCYISQLFHTVTLAPDRTMECQLVVCHPLRYCAVAMVAKASLEASVAVHSSDARRVGMMFDIFQFRFCVAIRHITVQQGAKRNIHTLGARSSQPRVSGCYCFGSYSVPK